ncbi:MAG: hypothetical protein WD512_18860 [Candidatus Paceibacterota bacterium]
MKVETGYGGVINPNAMLPPSNSHARWISAIPDYRFKMTKEFEQDYNQKKQIENALGNFELDRQLAPIMSRLNLNRKVLEKSIEYQNNIDKSEFFPDPNELSKQKAKLANKIEELNKIIESDRVKIEELNKKRSSQANSHDPVEDQKNYKLASNPILSRYGNPERYILNISYNGHLWPQDAWVYAIKTMIYKLHKFEIILNAIQDVSGRITDRALVQFNNVESPMPRIELIIDDKIEIESHTLGNLIKCHFIYLLDYIIEKLYPEKYTEVWSYCFSNYKVPHPLKTELVMTFQTPGQDFPLFPNSGRYKKVKEPQDAKADKNALGAQDDVDSDEDIDDKVLATDKTISSIPDNYGPFENLFDAETNETLRLLKITCKLLLDKFKDILVDAEKQAL